jgi:hypothetical protein
MPFNHKPRFRFVKISSPDLGTMLHCPAFVKAVLGLDYAEFALRAFPRATDLDDSISVFYEWEAGYEPVQESGKQNHGGQNHVEKWGAEGFFRLLYRVLQPVFAVLAAWREPVIRVKPQAAPW